MLTVVNFLMQIMNLMLEMLETENFLSYFPVN